MPPSEVKVERMRAPHLFSALVAVLISGLMILELRLHGAKEEDRNILRLASQSFPLKAQGEALQRAAFRRTDVLPIYGSSELEIADPYHVNNLFRAGPTGF